MTSDADRQAYVWVWLPGEIRPIVAGLLTLQGTRHVFNYGRNYLAHRQAIPLYEPELPLIPGLQQPRAGLGLAGCLRDAAPDAWGRRVVLNRLFGRQDHARDADDLDEITYLLESGSDRAGALDFQRSPRTYRRRGTGTPTLEQLLQVADRVEAGMPIDQELEQALFHGSSMGGARPKAMIEEGTRKYIAKFPSRDDTRNVVKAEFVAMRLAALAQIDAAPVRLVETAGRDVLLVERFDRLHAGAGWQRKAMVSALTLLELDEMSARYASYQDLAEIVRLRFRAPRKTLRELFCRLVFNILCGNTDDHARNHAAFWDGERLALTPAYDICPQNRTGGEASQAMLILGPQRQSCVALCLDAALHFQLGREDALDIVAAQIDAIVTHWDLVCAEARLSPVDRNLMWRRSILNPFALEGLPASIVDRAG